MVQQGPKPALVSAQRRKMIHEWERSLGIKPGIVGDEPFDTRYLRKLREDLAGYKRTLFRVLWMLNEEAHADDEQGKLDIARLNLRLERNNRASCALSAAIMTISAVLNEEDARVWDVAEWLRAELERFGGAQ